MAEIWLTKFILTRANRTQDYLGVDKTFYEPTEQGVEKKIKERLENWRKQFAETKKQK
jgi:replication-associated recombination protein RarA